MPEPLKIFTISAYFCCSTQVKLCAVIKNKIHGSTKKFFIKELMFEITVLKEVS